MTDKTEALKAVRKTAKRVEKAREALDHALTDRDAAVATARADTGATYPELADAAGMSPDRVKQVLTVHRAKTLTTN